MLTKINRLSKKKDFDNVYKNGLTSYDNIIGVKAIKNKLAESRFGILISNKVSKKAVERNKKRKQLRAIIRLELNKIKLGYDLMIICKPGIIERTYQDLEFSINKHFSKLKLYR